MAILDLVARAVAITVLLFVASFLILSLLSFWLPQVWPLRHSFLIALLSSASAAVPLVLIHLTRSATGGGSGSVASSGAFMIFAALAGAFALIFATLIISGQIRL